MTEEIEKNSDVVNNSSEVDNENRHLEENVPWYKWVSITFINYMMDIAKTRNLEKSDVGKGEAKMHPSYLYEKYETYEAQSEKKTKMHYLLCFARSSGIARFCLGYILFLSAELIAYLPTQILNVLVSDLEEESLSMDSYDVSSPANQTRWLYIILLLILPFISAFLTSWARLSLDKTAVNMKSVASEAVYQKALRLSSSGKGSISTGELLNVMSADTQSILRFTLSSCMILLVPISIIISICLVAVRLGKVVLIPVVGFAIMIALQFTSVIQAQKLRRKMMKKSDGRIKLMNEILTGIRVIKYYCWEKPFKGKVVDIRKEELQLSQFLSWVLGLGVESLTTVIPSIVPMFCFVFYSRITGKELTASTAYTCLSLFRLVQRPVTMLPNTFTMLVMFNVSLGRITNFLNLEEVDPSLVERNLPAGSKPVYKDLEGKEKTIEDYDAEKDAVIIREGHFAWGDSEPCLKDITTRIPKGSLVAVVGRVGSGKTSFISALIGEMTKKAGAVLVNGSISLSAQQAWLVNDTVRNNILFGKEYDEKKYKEVIKVCSLEDDLKVLTGGDQCEIGDRGINVSGGQKARISLARACYSDSDIVVMDDPIAAVDSHVGKALFNKCISSYMQGRTRILVTNATQYLSKCDYIIVLENQTISHQGTFAELKEQNVNLVSLLVDAVSESESAVEEVITPATIQPSEKKELVTEETKTKGRMSWSVFKYYLSNFGMCLCVWILFFFLAGSVFSVLSNFVLSSWSQSTCDPSDPSCADSMSRSMRLYSLFIILHAVCTVLHVVCNIPGKIRASKQLHGELTNSILDAPVAFHDVTPVGRILNRFSHDMATVDMELASSLTTTLSASCILLADCLNMTLSTYGLMIVIIVVVLCWFLSVQKGFRLVNTDIQRIESLTRTPVFTDFQGVLTGSPSIRAFGHQGRFIKGIEEKIYQNSHMSMCLHWCATWLTLRADCMAGVVCASVAMISNLVRSIMSPGLLGIALSSSTGLNNNIKQMIRMLAQTEAQMNAVERIKEYVDTVKPEPPMITEVRPPQNWPSEGKIEFKDAKLRYRDGPLVMKGVNLSIDSKEKIGVVGRTGAGKSTMMIALFRITDLCEGSISIDGMDLSKLGLEDVRRALCIIPQDPVLFSATVRFNLDPFNESTDEDIWNVLEQVELKDVIHNLPKGLDDDVHEGGSNFSVGERQLICMARALLRKPKILIMDEATASLDNTTDTFLQQMIRKQFAHCTTLTIAHRLNTIMDSTRVCVMDKGVVAEFDTPYNLLQKEDGIFKGMVLAANDPSLFDMVPGCEEMKRELKDVKQTNQMTLSPVETSIATNQ